ncbi:LPXTG cell wall anchor domain-containing protein [Enterococcus pallens]|uniref:LPXTG-domain-containing protein cell wall anchor domain n=1 Tax=Enterococcus pallens ATCC BAA-351 TaxID=1158607 RepID=R2QCP9_9ENTE|nr:LPXTG cell wall anchor domain-containing protein [Enterococcus pallens]EOH93008.1 LPXTG-domain-containing protein cell wall anchor domain [Enterococcus pallens ATCC BAA-351]EOU24794.1 hypothetical protein I588_00781 [Enterococcus pallens ATCC BAA-351]
MKQRTLVLLIAIFCVFFPTSVFGEELQKQETGVGIGFQTEQPAPADPTPYEPEPVNNVLPLTLGKQGYQAQGKGTLPQTGEQQNGRFLQLLGLSCLISCFWLFLFIRLREHEQDHE